MLNMSYQRKTVVVVINLAKTSRRDFLAGFLDRCNRHSEWNIRIIQDPTDFTDEAVRKWLLDGVNGAIVLEDGQPGAEDALVDSGIPVIIVGAHVNHGLDRRQNVVHLRIDDEKIGEFAAASLASLGSFNSAAFIPSDGSDLWSDLRGHGFTNAFAKRRMKVVTYDESRDGTLGAFLESLKKPAAVFAACDQIAYVALSALEAPKATVPEQIALLGVDNDELICNSTRPRLSSIRPDHYEEGAVAQRELDSLMRVRKPRPPKTILCTRMTLFKRESMGPVVPAARLLSAALEFIDRQAVYGITPSDVADHLGISRRLLDLRFQELHEKSVAKAILDVKIKAVKDALETTHDKISTITRNCGFANVNYLKNLFRNRFGMGMREWRRNLAHTTLSAKP